MGQPPLRALSFGDSLTSGYTNYGAKYEPYSEALASVFETTYFAQRLKIESDGKNGGITKDFPMRLEAIFDKTPTSKPFHWVIVLGGTNDLAYGLSPEIIFENLERTWSVAFRHGCNVLALTVPDIATTNQSAAYRRTAERRNKLNDLIRGYTHTGFHAFDLNAAFSFETMSEDDRKRFWSDTVHFTVEGYDRMGELVCAALVGILKTAQAEAQSNATGS